MMLGFTVTQSIGAAVHLGLPDLVSERPRPAEDLARAADADPDAVYRLLRTLASLGIFAEEDGIICHTTMSELLCSGAPGSLAPQSLVFSGVHYRTWGAGLEAFQTGEAAFPKVYGAVFFEWLAAHPGEASAFNAAMAAGAAVRGARLLDRDWSRASTVVDVGGGTGAALIRLLIQTPGLVGTVFDLPRVRPEAVAAIEKAGLADRCRFQGGDFFTDVPSGADVYILSSILHDWDDAAASTILATLRRAMTPLARLVLLERVVEPGNQPDQGKLLDLHMLMVLGGKERSATEWRDLLAHAGFEVTTIEAGLVEARPV